MCLQESTCQQLRQCMQAGGGALLQKLFDDYLLLRLDAKQRAGGKWKGKGAPASGPAADLPASPYTSCACAEPAQQSYPADLKA